MGSMQQFSSNYEMPEVVKYLIGRVVTLGFLYSVAGNSFPPAQLSINIMDSRNLSFSSNTHSNKQGKRCSVSNLLPKLYFIFSQ